RPATSCCGGSRPWLASRARCASSASTTSASLRPARATPRSSRCSSPIPGSRPCRRSTSRSRSSSMHAAAELDEIRTSEEVRPGAWKRIKELYAYREILMNLIRKEVKVKYTSSKLGAIWSMLNPLLYLAVFSVVFGVILKSKAPDFAVYLLSGLLAWNLLSTSLSLSARSVVDNANLVKKVYLPREILPLASVGAAVFDFFLQAIVLVLFMALTQ